MNFNDVAIASIKRSDYGLNFCYMNKYDAINIMKNSNFLKSRSLSFFFIIYKNEWYNLL